MPCDVVVSEDFAGEIGKADCLIDFTRPEGTLEHLRLCRENGVAMVIGTTGFDAAGKAEISAAAARIPIVSSRRTWRSVSIWCSSCSTRRHAFSTRVTTSRSSRPITGTRSMRRPVPRRAWARWWRRRLVATSTTARSTGAEGVTGERDPSTIGFATVRGGDIVGDHNDVLRHGRAGRDRASCR